MFPEFIHKPSPSWNERPVVAGLSRALIDTVIIHYTGMRSSEEALSRLCDESVEVSAHFLIDEKGVIYQLVEPEKRAWHAGVSHWQGRDNLNHTSIGIELVNPGHEFGYTPFSDAQIEALLAVLAHLQALFDIPKHRFIGHSDIAPERKTDPGELFPWHLLADVGFGVWPDISHFGGERNDTIVAKKGMISPKVALLNENLRFIGYNVGESDVFSQDTCDALTAFQRHWRQSDVTGVLDRETQSVVEAVAKLMSQYR